MRRWWPLTLRGTGALALAVLCFAVAHEAGLVELLYFAVLLCAVLVASFASLLLSRRSENVTRSLSPDVAAVGRRTAVRVHVGVRSAVPTSPGRWDDTLSSGLRGVSHGVFPAMPAGGRAGSAGIDLHYAVVGASRGVHSLGPLHVTATDPFGLARRRYRLGGPTRVVVAPAIVDLSALPTAPGETGGMLQTATAQPGQGADNLVARPYAPGDSMRRIHWRATAHRDTLMVRQEEQEASPEATVVLDRGVARWDPEARLAPGADPAFEAALSAAMSAAMRLVHEGYSVDVIDSDATGLSDTIAGGDVADVESLAARLATLTTREGEHLGTVAGLFAGILTGPVVIVTGRMDVRDAESLAPLAHHSSLPVVLATGADPEALERLRGTGWYAAPIDPDGDIASAWQTAFDRGVARVG